MIEPTIIKEMTQVGKIVGGAMATTTIEVILNDVYYKMRIEIIRLHSLNRICGW